MQDLPREALRTLPVASKFCPSCGTPNRKDGTTVSVSLYGYFTHHYTCRCAYCGVELNYHPLRQNGVSAGVHAPP